MHWLVSAIIAGITSFVATNIDDIVMLTIFFAQVNSKFRIKHIITGQYLGFAVLIFASLPGFFGGLIIPRSWIGLLGFIPIFIGINHLIHREEEEKKIQTVTDELNTSNLHLPWLSKLTSLLAMPTYHVAAVTIANGGDNVGIYVPLFASSNLAKLVVILLVFFIMIAVWCYIAYQLTRHAVVTRLLTHYGKIVLPFVLIGLGIHILIDSGTYQLLSIFSNR